MKTGVICLLMFANIAAQQNMEIAERKKRSLIEAGSFINFSSYKTRQNPGVYFGYWHRYPIDENKAHLELGLNFYYSNSMYDFEYGKKGQFYHIHNKEFLLNAGIRMVKEYPFRNRSIEWISELSLYNMFFNGKDIPDDEPENTDRKTAYIHTGTESVGTLRIGQGIRFWKNNLGWGIQASCMPFTLWYKNTVPEKFNSFSVETSINFRF